jgi:hypothetical protein
VLGEAVPDRGHVGQQGGTAQIEPRDLGQRGDTGVTAQVGDVGAGERQEGLTPVIITL